MRRKPLDLIFLLVMASAIPVTLACPARIVDEVTKCMQPVKDKTSGENQVMIMLVSGINKIKHLCRDGTIQEAFACLNRIYTSCAEHREDLERLEMMVGVGKWKRAVSNICNSLEYLADNVECEADVEREFRPCADRAIYLFKHQRREMQERYVKDHFGDRQINKAVMEMGCSLTNNILECLQIPYRTYCPARMADLVIDAFKDFIPPACVKRVLRTIAKHDPKYGPGGEMEEEEESSAQEEEEESENEERGENGERENNENGENGGYYSNRDSMETPTRRPSKGMLYPDKDGGIKNLVYSYNVPLVFPELVTKTPNIAIEPRPPGSLPAGQNGRSRKMDTDIQISRASDVARSTEDKENGGDSGAGSHFMYANSLMMLAAIILSYFANL